jgi:hypothetical protein
MSRSLSLPFLIVSPLLTIALGVWVLTSALHMTIGTPKQTEDLLNKSGVYQAVIPSQVADAQAANPSLQNLPLDNPEIQKILGNSPKLLGIMRSSLLLSYQLAVPEKLITTHSNQIRCRSNVCRLVSMLI